MRRTSRLKATVMIIAKTCQVPEILKDKFFLDDAPRSNLLPLSEREGTERAGRTSNDAGFVLIQLIRFASNQRDAIIRAFFIAP